MAQAISSSWGLGGSGLHEPCADRGRKKPAHGMNERSTVSLRSLGGNWRRRYCRRPTACVWWQHRKFKRPARAREVGRGVASTKMLTDQSARPTQVEQRSETVERERERVFVTDV